MFAFPALETEFDAEHAVEDPSDAFVLPRNAPTRAADVDRAKAFLEYIATPSMQRRVGDRSRAGLPPSRPSSLAAADRTALQEDGVRLIAAARHSTQFLDRDASVPTAGRFLDMLQAFVITPDQPIDPMLAKIQAAWDASR